MKKLAIALLLLILILAAGAVTAWQFFARGIGGFDDWVAREVVSIAEVYLVPDIEFKSFNYQDRTVTLHGVRLVAPDGTDVVIAGALRVTLESVPVMGKGLVISRVDIEDADLRLIRTKAADGSVEFRGLVPFLESDKIKKQDTVPEDKRLNTAFAIKHITLAACSVSYEPGDGQPTVTLTGIGADMDVSPRETGAAPAGGLGAYNLALEIDRAPILKITLAGALDLDTLALDLTSLALSADLASDDAIGALPGALQNLVRTHDVRGTVALDASGTIPGSAPLDSTLDAKLTLEGINVATGEYRFPIDTGTIDVRMANRTTNFPTLTLNTCGGTISANDARIDLSDTRRAELAWSVEGFHLRQLLRTHSEGEGAAPKIAGVVSSSGNASASLSDLPASVTGAGEIHVRDGHLVNMPLQKALAATMGLLDLITLQQAKMKDKADMAFTLDGQGVQISKGTAQTSTFAAKGDGTIYYDQRLDLIVNAGPLEKIQEKTGPIGDIIGLVTDQLVKYHVGGVLGDPKVTVRPLGLGK